MVETSHPKRVVDAATWHMPVVNLACTACKDSWYYIRFDLLVLFIFCVLTLDLTNRMLINVKKILLKTMFNYKSNDIIFCDILLIKYMVKISKKYEGTNKIGLG